jgi:hypothetical protein
MQEQKAINRKINFRQLACILFILTIGVKLISYPQMIYNQAGKSCIYSFLINFAFTFILVMAAIFIMKKNEDRGLDEILAKMFGKILTKVLLIPIFLVFLFKIVFLNLELKTFMLDTIYSGFDYKFFVIPIIFTIVLLASKGARTLGRASELFAGLLTIIIISSLVLSVKYLDLTNLIPHFDKGVLPIFNGVKSGLFFAGDVLILLMMAGKLERQIMRRKKKKPQYRTTAEYSLTNEKPKARKIAIFFVSGATLSFIFLLFSVLVLGSLNGSVSTSITKISEFGKGVSSMIKTEGVIVAFLMPILLLIMIVYSYGCIWCLKRICGFKKATIPMLIIGGLIYAATFFAGFFNLDIVKEIYGYGAAGIELIAVVLCFCISIFLKPKPLKEVAK